jgi:putative ATPase
MNEAPLADKLRPTSLDEYVGQSHLVGLGKPLRVAIENKHRFSFILWGPPGVGKTTLARIYANGLGAQFYNLSAVSATKDDIKKIIEGFKKISPLAPFLNSGEGSRRGEVVLFLDEIHRFNKAQQDFLLPYVENGTITLIGATTENPSFEVISPLLSRCRVFVLQELGKQEMEGIVNKTVKILKIKINRDAVDWLVAMANGDARQAITMIENTHNLYDKVTVESLKNTLQSKHLRYDKLGEEHYNTISAFIKSMRASDVDAALYYLARMVDSGEDPLFIARRMVVFASEDIGMAVPTALVVANAVFRACETIGYPECQENLAAGVAYLALCKKDRRAYDAYMEALSDVKKFGNLKIPLKVRNAPTKLMKELNYGKGYEMYGNESMLPEELKRKKYYKEIE